MMLQNGFRVFRRKGGPLQMLHIQDGRVVQELEPADGAPELKPGLYDLDLEYLGPEAADGSLITK